MTCPRCGRPAAIARPTCLYCAAPFPEDVARVPLAPAGATPPAVPDRALLVLDLGGTDPDVLARATGLSLFDARQRVGAGGHHLYRALPSAPAEDEAARLARAGLVVRVVPPDEAEGRTRPLRVRGGDGSGDSLLLQTEEGPLCVAPSALFLIVRGPITREYQTSPEVKRVRTATLEGGHRLHLHRRDDWHPLELDPLAFDFGNAALPSLSSLLTLLAWLRRAAPETPVDDGFRRLTPALAPAREEGAGRLGAAEALRAPRRASPREGRLVLDNVEQFRAYSAWRAAVELRPPV